MSDMLAENDAVNTPTAKTDQPAVQDNKIFNGVSEHLIGRINYLTYDPETENIEIDENNVVKGLITDITSSIESQWQTPFDNSNPDHKLPNIMASVQSGQTLNAIASGFTGNETFDGLAQKAVGLIDMLDPITGKLKEGLANLVGHTNLTKVNSQLVYLSTENRQFNLTLQFIAWSDAVVEVERQIMLLEQRVSPQYLAPKSILENLASDGFKGLFPSLIPPYVSLTAYGKRYYPLVIMSVSAPIKAPIDSKGNRLSVTVELTLRTRTAQDAKDIQEIYGITA